MLSFPSISILTDSSRLVKLSLLSTQTTFSPLLSTGQTAFTAIFGCCWTYVNYANRADCYRNQWRRAKAGGTDGNEKLMMEEGQGIGEAPKKRAICESDVQYQVVKIKNPMGKKQLAISIAMNFTIIFFRMDLWWVNVPLKWEKFHLQHNTLHKKACFFMQTFFLESFFFSMLFSDTFM